MKVTQPNSMSMTWGQLTASSYATAQSSWFVSDKSGNRQRGGTSCTGRTVRHEVQLTPRTSRAPKHPGNFGRLLGLGLGLSMEYLAYMRTRVQSPLLPKGKRERKKSKGLWENQGEGIVEEPRAWGSSLQRGCSHRTLGSADDKSYPL